MKTFLFLKTILEKIIKCKENESKMFIIIVLSNRLLQTHIDLEIVF